MLWVEKVGQDVVVIDVDTIADAIEREFYPGCKEYIPSKDSVRYVCLDNADRIVLYPNFEVVEQSPEHVVVRRASDGQLFKVTDPYAVRNILNIYLYPGITLLDLIGLEAAIEAEDNPSTFESKEETADFVYQIIEGVAYLAYKAGLIVMETRS